MQPTARDAACLWDMLDAAQAVQRYLAGKSLDDYLRDDQLRAAGNAASKSSAKPPAKSPSNSRPPAPIFPGVPLSASVTSWPTNTARSKTNASGA